jgi:hypothetical protein
VEVDARGRVALIIGGSVATAGTVSAAPPANDDALDATVIGSLPFVDDVDTTEATTSDEEAALKDQCGAPAMEQGVWYTATPTRSGTGLIDVTGSDFPAGIIVVSGSPGSFEFVTCAPGVVSGPFTAGETRYFMVFGFDASNPSGAMHLEVRDEIDAPVLELTVDPVAHIDRTGAANITGTVTCIAPDAQGFVEVVDGTVRQRAGRGFVDATFTTFPAVPCDGTTVPWTGVAVPDGRFASGRAATVAMSFACGPDQCSGDFVEATVRLTRGRVR